MEEKIISKEELQDLLTNITRRRQVFAPVNKGDSFTFEEIHPEDKISFTCANTKKSVKELFFPQRERLFAFNLLKKDESKVPDLPDRKRVIIGVRPCDAKGISLFDHVFDGKDFQDPYYLQKREDTVVIAIGCNAPERTCFCTSTGGSPFSTNGSDVLLVDLGDSFLVQPVTEKGEAFLEQESVTKKADQSQIQLKEKIIEKARSSVKSQIKSEKIKEKLDKNFDDPIWNKVHEKCLGCGACTFFCPTCHCFDILDETGGQTGERIRIWDSCMFPLFTLHASGVNPRPTGKERVRQRVMHKFKYFVDNHGEVACSGCGRCIKYCPVNLDIREVLEHIQDQP